MEKQRQLEWENQQLQKMHHDREQEQEKLLKLKARNQANTIELGSLNDKVKELSQKICDTRVAVSSVKSVIDDMRSTRDTHATEMATLKAKIKEQNAKLVQLSQEKAKMDSKYAKNDGLNQEIFATKQLNINQLRGKVQTLKEDIEPKESDVNANTEQLTELKGQLKTLLNDCEDIYSQYDSHRNQVLELKNNKKNSITSSAWDAAPAVQDAWSTSVASVTTAPTTTETAKTGYTPYRAVYEFYARNSDEITFRPGDIIMVPFEQNAEPGWLAGEINGHTGWFPETYAEKIEDEFAATDFAATADDNVNNYVQSETIEAAPEPQSTITKEAAVRGETYISCYPYDSTEPGDLSFGAGEYIIVTKKDGDWWTGTIGDRTGMFPSNYVQEEDSVQTATADTSYAQPITNSQNYSDDVVNQEEVDTEVSEINTQSKYESVQDNFNRPMSTSSTTSVSSTMIYLNAISYLSTLFKLSRSKCAFADKKLRKMGKIIIVFSIVTGYERQERRGGTGDSTLRSYKH